MKRKKYSKETKQVHLKWCVREKTGPHYDSIEFFPTKKTALKYVRDEIAEWGSGTTYELFKMDSNFIEAWVK